MVARSARGPACAAPALALSLAGVLSGVPALSGPERDRRHRQPRPAADPRPSGHVAGAVLVQGHSWVPARSQSSAAPADSLGGPCWAAGRSAPHGAQDGGTGSRSPWPQGAPCCGQSLHPVPRAAFGSLTSRMPPAFSGTDPARHLPQPLNPLCSLQPPVHGPAPRLSPPVLPPRGASGPGNPGRPALSLPASCGGEGVPSHRHHRDREVGFVWGMGSEGGPEARVCEVGQDR